MSKPKAYYTESDPSYQGTYNSGQSSAKYIYVDSSGNPILTKDLDNYDLSNPQQYFQLIPTIEQTHLDKQDIAETESPKPRSTSLFGPLFGEERVNLWNTPMYNGQYFQDTETYKNFREANDAVGRAVIDGFLLGPTTKGISQFGKGLWNGGKNLYKAWRLNPLWGAYQTTRNTIPLTTSFIAGMKGGELVDEGMKNFNGKTWSKTISDISGYPSFISDMTNPGYFIGGAGGYVFPEKYLSGVEKRAVEMAMKTSGKSEGTYVALKNHELKNIFNPKSSEGRDRLAYLLLGKKGSNGYNRLGTLDDYPYNGIFGKFDPGEQGVIDVAIHPDRELHPTIGKLAENQYDLGVHSDYISTKYPDRKPRVYELDSSTLVDYPSNKTAEQILNGKQTVGVYNNIILKTPNKTGGFIEFDASGHIREYRRDPITNELMFRDQDIWKFNPDEYELKWLQNDLTDNMKELMRKDPKLKEQYLKDFRKNNKILDAGLRLVDKVVTPNIYRTPWYRSTLNDEIPQTSEFEPFDSNKIQFSEEAFLEALKKFDFSTLTNPK